MKQKILLLQIAALGYNYLRKNIDNQRFFGLDVKPIQALFPALTCVVQATMRTASFPAQHGIVGNGFFLREQWKPVFWEQNSRLIEVPYIWEHFRSRGGKVAQMFIQQSLGHGSDVLFSPAPVHKHSGGIIMDCISEPSYLNDRLRKDVGSIFPLHRYWGPLASKKSSVWIAKAAINIMHNETPDLLYIYLPHLDYALQRYGPRAKRSRKAFLEISSIIRELLIAAKKKEYQVILFGDYSVVSANSVVYPNRVLRTAGLLKTRNIKGMEYPNLYTSAAFCVVDHQIAHVYVFQQDKKEQVKSLFGTVLHVDTILDQCGKARTGIGHPRSGEFVLVARQGAWFDYRWWYERKKSPEYAFHVDIHNKPGYDPCELLFGWPPWISQNPLRIKGTHGRVDENEPVFYASDVELPGSPGTLMDLSVSIKDFLNSIY